MRDSTTKFFGVPSYIYLSGEAKTSGDYLPGVGLKRCNSGEIMEFRLIWFQNEMVLRF